MQNKDSVKTKFFEAHFVEIEKELEKRRHKWFLRGVMMIEFEDIKSIVLAHIYKKLHLYNEKLPLLNWVNTIISNQISNILRNNYYSHSRPCIQKGGCAFNDGNDFCSYTKSGLQSDECPIYASWAKSKKHANDIRMSLPMENHLTEIFDIPNSHYDISNNIEEFHVKIRKYLKPFEYRIYECLFILGLSEADTAKKLGYKSKEKFKYPGYASIAKAKKIILKTGKKILQNGEIDMI